MDIQAARKIKALMVERGITQTSIVQLEDVSVVFVHLVIYGKRKGQRVREAIADSPGVSIDDLNPLRGRSNLTPRPPNLKWIINCWPNLFQLKFEKEVLNLNMEFKSKCQ